MFQKRFQRQIRPTKYHFVVPALTRTNPCLILMEYENAAVVGLEPVLVSISSIFLAHARTEKNLKY